MKICTRKHTYMITLKLSEVNCFIFFTWIGQNRKSGAEVAIIRKKRGLKKWYCCGWEMGRDEARQEKKEEEHGQGEGGGGDKIKDRQGEGDRYRGKDGCRAADTNWSCTRMAWPACSVMVDTLAISQGISISTWPAKLGIFFLRLLVSTCRQSQWHIPTFPSTFPHRIMCTVAI